MRIQPTEKGARPMNQQQALRRIARIALWAAVAFAIACASSLIGSRSMEADPFTGARIAYADPGLSVSFAEKPQVPSASGNFSVKIKGEPSIPAYDVMDYDPYEVYVGVLLVPAKESLDPANPDKHPSLIRKKWTGTEGERIAEISDYLTESSLPKPGDKLIPYVETYAFDMGSYSVTRSAFVTGEPFVIEGDAPGGSDEEFGSLKVIFVDENGAEVPGGDFDITPVSGTGTKELMSRMPFGSYAVTCTVIPEGYEPNGRTRETVKIDAASPHAVVSFKLKKEQEAPGPQDKSIPYAMLTPVLAPDHPQVFIRIEDDAVHPVNGLEVEVVAPDGSGHPVLSPKLNSSDETPHKILALPLSEFSEGLGDYLIRLKQDGYTTTEIPFKLAERTATPSVNEADGGYVYVSDGRLSVSTEAEAQLEISFLIDPRLEDGVIRLDPARISSNGAGEFEADFSALAARLSTHRVVKVVAQAPGKAPSDIIEVSLIQKRNEAPAPDEPQNPDGPDAPAPGEQGGQTPGGPEGNASVTPGTHDSGNETKPRSANDGDGQGEPQAAMAKMKAGRMPATGDSLPIDAAAAAGMLAGAALIAAARKRARR